MTNLSDFPDMLKKIVIPAFIALLALAYLLSCGSGLNDDQLKVQQHFTHLLSAKVQNKLEQLSHLANSYSSPQDLFTTLQEQLASLDAVFILNESLEITALYPQREQKKNNNLLKLLSVKIKGRLGAKPLPQVYFSKGYKKMWFFLGLNNADSSSLALELDTYDFFDKFTDLYFPRPYNLAIMDEENVIVFSEQQQQIGSKFVDIEGSEAAYDLEYLQDNIRQNDVSYSMIQYRSQQAQLSTLFTWEAINIFNKKLWVIAYRYIAPKSSPEEDQTYLLAALRSYAVKDTLIKSIINKKSDQVEDIIAEVYEKNRELYSIQFADSTQKIVYGIPASNSIVDYSPVMKKFPGFDETILEVYRKKEMRTISDTLLEGGEATIIILPVEFGNDVVGSLISVQLQD